METEESFGFRLFLIFVIFTLFNKAKLHILLLYKLVL